MNTQNYSDHGVIPPQALNVEEALLGGLINEPEEIGSIMAFLSVDAFYNESNKIIYSTIIKLF